MLSQCLAWSEMMMLMGLGGPPLRQAASRGGPSLGQGIVEFKKGLNGAADELDISGTGRSSSSYGSSCACHEQRRPRVDLHGATVPKFELPGTSSRTCRAARRWSIRPRRRSGLSRSAVPRSTWATRPSASARRARRTAWRAARPVCGGRPRSRSIAEGPAAAAGRLVERNVQTIAHRDLARSGRSIGSAKMSIRVSIESGRRRSPRRDLDPLADVHRPEERHGVDRGGRDLTLARMPQRSDRHRTRRPAAKDAAVDRAERVGLARAR